MIPSGTVKATMEEFNIEQGEHISHDGPKSSYAKRSNVVGMWRKKEEEIKSLKSKEQQTRQMQSEEKKEGNEEFEHDSRQQETNYSDMFPSDPLAGIVPDEPTAETSFEQRTPATAPRRSNVRDSWKKKAASPSAYSSQPSSGINESPSNANASAFDELKSKWKKFGVENGGDGKPESIENKITDRKVDVKAEEKPTPEKFTETSTEQVAKSSEAKQTLRGVAARRIGSNRFRSRVARKPTISATNSMDEIMGGSEAGTTPDKEVSDSPSHSAPVIEKELVPPFPTNELDTRETPKSPVVNYSRHNEVTPTSPLSPASSTISRSSLSERANRRLRDIRTKSHPRNEEDEDTKPKKAADLDTSDMPMDESIAFKESMRSQGSNLTSDNFIDAQTSPLNTVVPDMENMVPDQFFSEKDANVDSMKSVIQQTSFVQIANDMKEEASTLMEFDFISEGVHSALYALGLEHMFPAKSPKRSIQRAPSPVEEVAIEVEYVADAEE